MNATPSKLKNGSWGARVNGACRKGDTITITTRAGKSWQAVVSAVVWTGEGVTLVATETNDEDRPSNRSQSERKRARHGYRAERMDCRRYGWDGVVGSSSYYSSGQYDEDS